MESSGLIGRRALVGGALAGAASLAEPARAQPAKPAGDPARALKPDIAADQSDALARALAATASDGRELRLAPGEYRVEDVSVPAGARLSGAGRVVLVGGGARPILRAAGGEAIAIRGIELRGQAGPFGTPLLHLADIGHVTIEAVTLTGGRGPAIRAERCGGRIAECRISACDVGLFSLDAAGLRITGNTIEGCADNAIQIWRSAKGYDGTILSENRIARIGNRSGGSGEYGNGINIFRAGNVMVSGNAIRDCAFSAIRNNAGDNVQIEGNNCTGSGEVGIFVEFGFQGCVVANNVVDRASVGISMTNFDAGGRLALATGNILRNLFRRPDALSGVIGQGIGISAEADAVVTANVIEAAEHAGIWIGYGPHQRDVLCSGNVVRASPIGIAASVAPQAGAAQITGNLLSGCTRGAVVAFEWEKAASGDLTAGGQRYANLTVAGNTVR